MRSSTSSSSHDIPAGGWGPTWAVALAIVALAATVLESQARRLGVRPSWNAGAESWCVEASQLGPGDIAILGTSRALSGIEPGALSRATGRGVRHLAINASSILPALEWLASKDDFAGLAVAEFIPGLEFRAGRERQVIAERFVAYYPDFVASPARHLDAILARQVQTRLAFRSPGFHLIAPYRDRRGPGAARLKSMSVEASRFVRLEYEPGSRDGRPAPARKTAVGDEERAELMERFAAAIQAIERRGGKVVLLFMPISGSTAEAEERDFPRARYWDPLADSTGALKIHYRDVPALAGFACPDGEHLDAADAVRFARALAATIFEELDL